MADTGNFSESELNDLIFADSNAILHGLFRRYFTYQGFPL
jgi:hypothetical protein